MTAVLIDEHVHEKVFNDRIAELLAKAPTNNPIKMAESELIHQTHCQMKTL
jgi:hypothetical protein